MTIQEIRKQIEKAMPNRNGNVKIDNNAAANLALNAKSSDEMKVDGGNTKIVFCACKGSAKNLQFCLYKQNNNLFKLKLEHCGKDFERFLSGRRFDYEITGISGDLDSIWTALQQAQKWYNGQDTRNDSSIRKIYEDYKAWKSTQKSQNSKSSQKKTSVKNITGEQQQSFEDALNEEWGQVQKLLKEIDESSHDVAAERLLWKNPEQNPWIEFSKEIDLWLERKEHGEDVEDIKRYILEGDAENQKLEKFCTPERGEGQIHLEIPPQPYIGDPKANIWLLLMNPSYSEMDIYDMVCCKNDQNDLKRNILSSIRFKDEDGKRGYTKDEINLLLRYFFTSGSDSDESLSDRKKLMQNQLSFDSTDFYVLNKPFKTVQTREEIRKASGETVERKDDTKLGSYEWWNYYFFSGEKSICRLTRIDPQNEEKRKEVLEKFFVLESFPYHSISFGDHIKPWNHSESHFLFWVKMVAYALANKKILLCRGMDIAERVAKIAEKISKDYADGAKRKQIFVSTSSGSFSISTGNFISYEAKKNIDNTESKAKKVFVNEIGEKLKEQ